MRSNTSCEAGTKWTIPFPAANNPIMFGNFFTIGHNLPEKHCAGMQAEIPSLQ
jgi:hypothetical protein